MNCKDALRLLYDVIDKEADQLDTVEVEKHLQHCRHCMAKYEFERMFRTFVTEKGHNVADNSHLKNQILRKLDAIDAAGEVGDPNRPFRRYALVWATAAAIVLVAATAFWTHSVEQRRAQLTPFIEAHYAHPVTAQQTFSPGAGPFDFLYQHTGIRLAPTESCPVERLRSVTIDTVAGTVFGRLAFICDNGQPVTMFVARADSFQLPTEPIATIDGGEWLAHSCREGNMIGRTKDGLVFIVAGSSEHPPEQLVRLVSAF